MGKILSGILFHARQIFPDRVNGSSGKSPPFCYGPTFYYDGTGMRKTDDVEYHAFVTTLFHARIQQIKKMPDFSAKTDNST